MITKNLRLFLNTNAKGTLMQIFTQHLWVTASGFFSSELTETRIFLFLSMFTAFERDEYHDKYHFLIKNYTLLNSQESLF